MLKRNSLNNRKSEFHLLALLHKFKIERNIIRQFDHSFLEKWYPRKITDNPYTILKKEKERERTFEPSYFHESFRNRNRDAAAGIGVEGRTILLDWDEGFKQGIKKEGRIGARSLDRFKSLRSWKYVSFPSPSLLPPRKWKDTNVSREPVNSSRGSQSRPRFNINVNWNRFECGAEHGGGTGPTGPCIYTSKKPRHLGILLSPSRI